MGSKKLGGFKLGDRACRCSSYSSNSTVYLHVDDQHAHKLAAISLSSAPLLFMGSNGLDKVTFGLFDWYHGLLPRTYPPAFGMFLRRHHERFTRHCVVACEVPDDVMKQDLPVFFQSLEWGDLWEDAELFSCLSYLRASKRLHIGEWRNLIPTFL